MQPYKKQSVLLTVGLGVGGGVGRVVVGVLVGRGVGGREGRFVAVYIHSNIHCINIRNINNINK